MSYQWKPKTQKPTDPILPERLSLIVKAFDEKGLEYILNGDDRHEIEFWDTVRANPKSHRKYVNGIYRLKTNKQYVKDQTSDEVLIYSMSQEAEKYDGSHIQDDRTHGVIFKPDVRNNKNAQGKRQKVQFLGEIPYFLIPFSQEAVDVIIAKSDVGVDKFHVGYAANRGPEVITGHYYSILNLEDFIKGTFEELMDMGAYNYSAKLPRLEQWRAEGEEIKKTAHTVRSQGSQVRRS